MQTCSFSIAMPQLKLVAFLGHSLADFEAFRCDGLSGTVSPYYDILSKVFSWITVLRGLAEKHESSGILVQLRQSVLDVLEVIEKMLAENKDERPIAKEVWRRCSGQSWQGSRGFCGDCCRAPIYPNSSSLDDFSYSVTV